MNDPYDLQRFLEAQERVYRRVREELSAGRKESHWMWFVFPQIAGLGRSARAQEYAISSREEAQAYVRHPVLGARLKECAELVRRVDGRSTQEIFGGVDEMKFRSSMTLFANAAPDIPVFKECLDKFFGGEPDPATVERL
jgi:uncharacterized protein (DUF1810 family)